MGRHHATKPAARPATHSHAHSHDAVPDGGMTQPRLTLLIALAFVAVVTAIGLVAVWPHASTEDATSDEFAQTYSLNQPRVNGEVTAVEQCQAQPASPQPASPQSESPQPEEPHECRTATVAITSGDAEGETTTLTHYGVPGEPQLNEGDKIVLSVAHDVTGTASYAFADYQRGTSLLLWGVIVAAAIVVFAAWHGLRSLIALALSLGVVFFFLLPGLAGGSHPVALALTACSAIILLSVPIVHGLNWKSASALGGNMVALAVAAVLARVAIGSTHLQGMSSEDNLHLALYMPGVSIVGVLLCGFIVGTLGGLNDVTIGQASTVTELSQSNPDAGPLQLFASAMKVGRDHISSVVYTIVLTYAGAMLPLLMMMQASHQHAGSLLGSDLMATELLRSGVGALALALAVPLTTLIAAWTVPTRSREDLWQGNK